jgi:two-component system chemotaxis response regulator CheY
MKQGNTAKIIIADDLASMRVGLRRALKQLGFENVLEGASGTEAMALLEANADTALIISDWNMEPMDGLEFLRAVRMDARFKSLPFILVSADANPHMRDKAAVAGVSLVLAKPFDAGILSKAFAGLGGVQSPAAGAA